jgi:hypothetical protein
MEHNADDLRSDFVAITRDLAPGAIRFGGLFKPVLPLARGRRSGGASVPQCGITFGAAQRDPSIALIGCGDRGKDGNPWAPEVKKQAGEYLSYIAIHKMGQSPKRPGTVLRGLRYQSDPQRAWEELIELAAAVGRRVVEIEPACIAPIAIAEGHLSLSVTRRSTSAAAV